MIQQKEHTENVISKVEFFDGIEKAINHFRIGFNYIRHYTLLYLQSCTYRMNKRFK